jgi:hypothetical protein
MTMASFESMPNELKDSIFASLTTTDLLNVGATCKSLHTLATRRAHQHLRLHWQYYDEEPCNYGPSLELLHDTLRNRPDLKQLVKSLTLSTSLGVDISDPSVVLFNFKFDFKLNFKGKEKDFYPSMLRVLSQFT